MKPSTKIPFDIREPVAEDANFIIDTWLKSYRQHSKNFKSFVASDVYTKYFRQVIVTMLMDNDCRIAHAKDDESQIYGYVVGNKEVLHYIYVKSPFRKFGIARTLCEEIAENSTIPYYTHYTHYAKNLVQRLNGRYNPFLLMKGV